MSIDVKLYHRTAYRYSQPVQLGPQIVRLRPAPHCRTEILSYSQRILPKGPDGHWCNWQQDAFANFQARLVFPEPANEFVVEVDLVARIEAYNPFDFFLEESAENWPFKYSSDELEDLKPYLRVAKPGPLLTDFLDQVDRTKRRTIDFIVDANRLVNRTTEYVIRLEPGTQTPEETLASGRGSCRDSAWLLVNVLRQLGLAARFVSGYSIQLKADQKALDGPSGVEQDICDLHAWAEVYLPGAGWVGMDATSGLMCGEGHIPLAATPEIGTAAPITGAFHFSGEGLETDFDFEMNVQRIYETPRVTKPYTAAQWDAIDLLGSQIDQRLEASDARLTMGGEPTFVSIDDFESPEWTTNALGEHKTQRAEDLLRRLYGHYAKGGFLHYGQGKWYPGEQLPRWAYSAIWRKDGQPLWTEPELLGDLGVDYGFTAETADSFIQTLCDRLLLPADHVIPGFEDVWYYLWKERRLPANVNPLDNRLEDEFERLRLARIFEQGLDKIVGYALPIERGWVAGQYSWVTGPWFLRPETLFLIPGDSPMGLRLPLDSLPWIESSDKRYFGETSAPEDLPPLPDREALARQYFRPVSDAGGRPVSPWEDYFRRFRLPGGPQSGDLRRLPPHMRARSESMPAADHPPLPSKSAPWIVRTALCVEAREGKLFVFMPPAASTEDYVDLLTAVEATAASLDLPVVIEGYLPPHDPRLQEVKVTPDPGVLEVNIHPSRNWQELSEKTQFLYEQAREARLGTEKWQLDGRHVGTGGGNHIVIGAEHPADSPLLRNPKLLASLVAYWHQHPGLSYLFSGAFIGPTSQAPRFDEARTESVHEMEIALRELDRLSSDGQAVSPWITDRLFRNLLIDVTGNTHRAEFCIDKLYAPESSSGRLGLLEMRAFEMPPHWQMSLVQHLLLRGLIARFWETPFEPTRLTRWDTQLHDRWMLPHFVSEDLQDVVADLHRWGIPFESEWLVPHFEFRFPTAGHINKRGIELELRQALEPWHVMGEEPGPGGTVRYVDSSVERLQVRVCGLNGDRFAVTCNGLRLPLASTGTKGEFVAAVRFRAWQPPTCLHPTIEVHSPLVFDIVDTWNRASLGGVRYHVAHPGGRGNDTFPVNALEAESRRLARFETTAHTVGPVDVQSTPACSRDYPLTLDLRDPVTRLTL